LDLAYTQVTISFLLFCHQKHFLNGA
jgi:hypothetical protein